MAEHPFNDFLSAHRKDLLDGYQLALNNSLQHKMSAHERLFRLQLNLNTLALTAWIGLVTWKTAEFKVTPHAVLIPCAWHIFSLMMTSLSDVFLMLQSRVQDELMFKERASCTGEFALIDLNLADLIRRYGPEYAHFRETIDAGLAKLNQTLDSKERKKRNKCIMIFYNLSWFVGIAAYLLFFFAVANSVYAMTSFIEAAKSLPAIS